MTANTSQIFSKVGDIQWISTDSDTPTFTAGPLKTADTSKDGTSAGVLVLFTADGTNGGRVEGVRIRAVGTNIATALRIFRPGDSTSFLVLLLAFVSASVANIMQNQSNANKQIQASQANSEKTLVQSSINSEKLDGLHDMSNSRLSEMMDKIAALERTIGNLQGVAAEKDNASKTGDDITETH